MSNNLVTLTTEHFDLMRAIPEIKMVPMGNQYFFNTIQPYGCCTAIFRHCGYHQQIITLVEIYMIHKCIDLYFQFKNCVLAFVLHLRLQLTHDKLSNLKWVTGFDSSVLVHSKFSTLKSFVFLNFKVFKIYVPNMYS